MYEDQRKQPREATPTFPVGLFFDVKIVILPFFLRLWGFDLCAGFLYLSAECKFVLGEQNVKSPRMVGRLVCLWAFLFGGNRH
jgi:hypothetical protein